MTDVTFSLGGVVTRVSTEDAAYAEFLRRYFHRVLSEAEPQVSIEARWMQDVWGRRKLALRGEGDEGTDAIGSNALLGEGRILKLEKIRRRRFRFAFHLDGDRLRGTVTCLATGRQALERRDDALFANLSYYIVVYPVFWYLESFTGQHVLHAAAVKVQDRTVVVFGLDGAGKTMLTLGLLAQPDARFISDNLLIYGTDEIHSCLQPLKVRHEYAGLVPEGKLRRLAGYQLRTYYEASDPLLSDRVERGVILLPRFAAQPGLRPMARDACVSLMETMNTIPFELEMYDHYARLFNLMRGGGALGPARRAALERLLSRCTAYQLDIGPGETAAQVTARVVGEALR